jgi:hypothetical protein
MAQRNQQARRKRNLLVRALEALLKARQKGNLARAVEAHRTHQKNWPAVNCLAVVVVVINRVNVRKSCPVKRRSVHRRVKKMG